MTTTHSKQLSAAHAATYFIIYTNEMTTRATAPTKLCLICKMSVFFPEIFGDSQIVEFRLNHNVIDWKWFFMLYYWNLSWLLFSLNLRVHFFHHFNNILPPHKYADSFELNTAPHVQTPHLHIERCKRKTKKFDKYFPFPIIISHQFYILIDFYVLLCVIASFRFQCCQWNYLFVLLFFVIVIDDLWTYDGKAKLYASYFCWC